MVKIIDRDRQLSLTISNYAFSALEKHAPEASETALRAARVLVCLAALMNAVWENLPSAALIPAGIHSDMGTFSLLSELLLRSPLALWLLQIATIAALIAALLGYQSRVSVPVAACLYFAFGLTLRVATGVFYHTGVVSTWLLIVLAFASRAPANNFNSRTRGLSLWALWASVAAFYAMAGTSKLRASGLDWIDAEMMRGFILQANSAPMQFSWTWGNAALHAPNSVLAAAAAFSLFVELAFPLALFSRPARALLPLGALGMHLGIWATQRILFHDLMLFQILFYLPWLFPARDEIPAATKAAPAAPRWMWGALAIWLGILATSWRSRAADFPFDDVAMFASGARDGIVIWEQASAIYADGQRAPAPIAEMIPALKDTRFRFSMSNAFARKTARRDFAILLGSVAQNWNSDAARPTIVGFKIERRKWDYLTHPREQRGEIINSFTVACPVEYR